MANDNVKIYDANGDVVYSGVFPLSASNKPEVADKPSFLKDVKNGLVHYLHTVWAVPEARGKIATLLVRIAVPLLPASVGTLATILIETLTK